MNVWLSLPFLSAAGLRELALAADEAGVAGLALSEHVCVPASFASPYPYGGNRPVELPVETDLPDPLVTAAALAAITTRVRFMTGVLIAPLRHPVLLAKEVATVAAFSDGRFDLGVGVGWLREEFEALGLDTFDRRGRVLDEMLPLLPRLWTGRPVAHDGASFTFDAVAVNPAPPAPVALFIGGTSNAALRRCATYGDGWVGANHSVDELRDVSRRLAEAREVAGTADRAFTMRTGIRGSVTPERVTALRELGVDSLLVAPWQLGERRDSIHDVPVEALVDGLPGLVSSVLAST